MTSHASVPAALRWAPGTSQESHTHERSRERNRRALLGAGSGLLSRGLSAAVLLAAVPLVGHRFGSEGLGLWVLLVTGVALLGFVDLGLGNGLLNVLAPALGRRDHNLARRAVSSAFFCLLGLSAMVAVGYFTFARTLPWARILGVEGPRAGDARMVVSLFVASVVVSMPLAVGQRVRAAYQESWAAGLTTAAGNLLSLVGLGVAAATHAAFPVFVLAGLGGVPLAYLVEDIWVFSRAHADLRPRLAQVEWALAIELARTGFLFFVLAVAGAVAYQSDTIVISHYLGANQVAPYAIPLRLFSIAPAVAAAVVMPLWPAYGEALARGDTGWVSTTVRRSFVATGAIVIVPSLVLLVATGPVLRLLGKQVAGAPVTLFLGLAAWAVVSAASTTLGMFMNGARVVAPQIAAAAAMMTANLALSIAWVRPFGIAGPIWASVLTQVFLVLIPESMVAHRIWRRYPRAELSAPAAVLAGPQVPAVATR